MAYIFPKGYKPMFAPEAMEQAIEQIKSIFQKTL